MNMQVSERDYHYGVMRRAIELIDRDGGNLPLDDLAREMGMSSAHFQRIFSAWVGVSPKRYQQYLKLGHAKALLEDRLFDEPVFGSQLRRPRPALTPRT